MRGSGPTAQTGATGYFGNVRTDAPREGRKAAEDDDRRDRSAKSSVTVHAPEGVVEQVATRTRTVDSFSQLQDQTLDQDSTVGLVRVRVLERQIDVQQPTVQGVESPTTQTLQTRAGSIHLRTPFAEARRQ